MSLLRLNYYYVYILRCYYFKNHYIVGMESYWFCWNNINNGCGDFCFIVKICQCSFFNYFALFKYKKKKFSYANLTLLNNSCIITYACLCSLYVFGFSLDAVVSIVSIVFIAFAVLWWCLSALSSVSYQQ